MRSEQPASKEWSTPRNEIASAAWTLTSAHANAVLDAALNGDVCTCGKKTIQAASHHSVDCPYRLLTEAAQMLAGCTPQAFGDSASRTVPSADLTAIGQAIIDSKPRAGRHKVQFALARQVLVVTMQCRLVLMLQRQDAAGNNVNVGPIDQDIEALGDIEQACHAEVLGYGRSPARWKRHTSFPHMVSAHLNAWCTALEEDRAAVATQAGPGDVLAADRWVDAVSELRLLCATAIHELSDGASHSAAEC